MSLKPKSQLNPEPKTGDAIKNHWFRLTFIKTHSLVKTHNL